MIPDDCFSTVTPVCVTLCGRRDNAWLTRFWTLTWLMSALLPGLNTALIETLPDDELVDEK